MMALISLTTDFGTRDGYIGVMKGVILGITPDAQIVDISHEISPQNIREGAFILTAHAGYFPAETVHVVVVDPGVGTDRRPIAARIGKHTYVAPDNGILTPLLNQARQQGTKTELVNLNNPDYWLPEISHTFHGRDIFAPCGAHLAAGVPMLMMGDLIEDPVEFNLPLPETGDQVVTGEIIYIDRFGNAISNIQLRDIAHLGEVVIHYRNHAIEGIVKTFGEGGGGELIALWDSSKYLTVTMFGGLLNLDPQIGEIVTVEACKYPCIK